MSLETEATTYKSFFMSSFLWLGVVLVLFSIVLDGQYPDMGFILSVLVNFLDSIGIAVIVASIFTFASGTSEFVEKIRGLLQDIVVSRNFLGNIDATSKREALNSLIKPSSEEKNVYSNIEDYLNTYISQTMDVTKKCVRSNYNVSAHAFIDKIKGKVIVESRVSYRLFPTKDGYSDIQLGFLEDDTDSFCSKIVVSTPDGERVVHDDLKYNIEELSGTKVRMITIDLSKYGKNFHHLDISLVMVESGNDHWILLPFITLMPTDGFKYDIRCGDRLKINSHQVFTHGANFHVDNDGPDQFCISCNEWITEGTGITILISVPHDPIITPCDDEKEVKVIDE